MNAYMYVAIDVGMNRGHIIVCLNISVFESYAAQSMPTYLNWLLSLKQGCLTLRVQKLLGKPCMIIVYLKISFSEAAGNLIRISLFSGPRRSKRG